MIIINLNKEKAMKKILAAVLSKYVCSYTDFAGTAQTAGTTVCVVANEPIL